MALVAEDLGVELVVPLPMPETLYAQDFESSRSWAEFGRLNRYAVARTTLPLAPGSSEASIADYGPERNRKDGEPSSGLAPLQTRWLGAQGEDYDTFPPDWAGLLNAPVTREATESAEAEKMVERSTTVNGYHLPLVIGVSGQLGYYRRKAAQWIKRNRSTERLSMLSLGTSIIVILLILFGGTTSGGSAARHHEASASAGMVFLSARYM